MIAVDAPRQIGWRDRRTATPDPRRRPAVVEDGNPIRWRDCPTCWASGRIMDRATFINHPCATCLGLGQVMR